METRYLTGATHTVLNIAFALATFMIVLDYSIANVSIPYISGDLAVSVDQGTYVITSFAVGNGISLAFSAWLTKRFGAIRLLLASLLLFVFFSWMCGASWNFDMLIVGRFLQGFVSGPLIPISQTLLIQYNPPEKRNAVMSFWAMVVIVGPVVGPILGGWLTYDYKWIWIFYINIPIGLIAAFCIWHIIGKDKDKTEKTPLEWVGLLLLTIAVTTLQIVLDKGQQWDWLRSPLVRTLATTSLLSWSFLLVWELTHPRPLLDLKLMRIRSFWVSIVCIATAYAMYFGSVVLVPLWLQTNMNYTSPWAGIAVAPIGLIPVLSSGLITRVLNRYGKIGPLAFSFLLLSLSCFYTAYFTTDVDLYHVAFSRFLFGCGLTFFFTPLVALSVQDIPSEKLANATSLFHFIRAIFGGIGTSIFTTLWLRRGYYYHERSGELLTEYTQSGPDFYAAVAQAGITGEPARSLLNDAVDNQAALLSINECFYVMAWAFLALIFVILLAAKRNTKTQIAPKFL